MTLGFSTKINNRESFFPQKILAGLHYVLKMGFVLNDYLETPYDLTKNEYIDEVLKYEKSPKIHTIRRDEKDRWKPGNKIHFVTGNRTKDRFQFAPVLTVKAIQKIRILQCDGNPCVYLWAGDEVGFMPFAFQGYNDEGLKALAINDGFESVEAFFEYFNEDFEGKIIHWTDTKYQF